MQLTSAFDMDKRDALQSLKLIIAAMRVSKALKFYVAAQTNLIDSICKKLFDSMTINTEMTEICLLILLDLMENDETHKAVLKYDILSFLNTCLLH